MSQEDNYTDVLLEEIREQYRIILEKLHILNKDIDRPAVLNSEINNESEIT